MLEVGKVVINKAIDEKYSKRAEDALGVHMGEHGMLLTISTDNGMTNGTEKAMALAVTADQAIEYAQLILKAAELQPRYADEFKRLRDELDNLATVYKELISGDGTGTELTVGVLDEHGTFVTSEPSALGGTP